MEIPDNLKLLYKHWSKHTIKPYGEFNYSKVNTLLLNDINNFINERMFIWERKVHNKRILTKDTILKNYKFCNIYRELDKQTIEIHSLLKPIENNFNLWLLNLLFCRFICKIETVKKIGLLSFDESSNINVLNKLKSLPSPKYGNAYIFPVSLIITGKYKTREDFFCKYLPTKIQECSKKILAFNSVSVEEALNEILPVFGYNFKFHWTEVFIDIAYQFPHLIDLYKNFPIGPGSLPTIEQISRDLKPNQLVVYLTNYNLQEFPYLTYNRKPIYLSAENWEGIGCEYRKYQNLKNGFGRKRKYIN